MNKFDVQKHIDEAKFGKFHWLILIVCSMLMIFDGYDLFIFGVVLPVVMNEWGLTPVQAGALGSYSLFGMMFGALLLGMLADKIGRKRGIIVAFVVFSVATFLNGFATNTTEFGLARFFAGLGCGGLMPNAVALINELAPRRMRNTLVTLMFSGFSLGGVFAAGLGIYLMPKFGWNIMFFAGAAPLLLLPFIIYYLPESLGFLIRKGRHEEARKMLKEIQPDSQTVDPSAELVVIERKTVAKGSVLDLFTEGRLIGTLAFWVAFFCCLLMVYALGSWLPKLMNNAGYSLGSSLSFLLALNFGGAAGAILGGWLGDRYNLGKIIIVFFIASVASISLMGFNSPMPVLYALITTAGATVIGTQILIYAAVAQFYGLAYRSTGLGWASAVGRTGAIVGPILGGFLLAMQMPLQANFIAFAIPGAVAALAMIIFVMVGNPRAENFYGLPGEA
ncbi:MAG: MFS transporter [Gammaproteobacteria bacterium]|nr:MFS transporter [Gammaproteobacteria bacterium]